ncbi:MAG TPA: pitrilysin family protein [Candidatus Polarisedimenticolia bacterium]|nr:pitrilysin family protein [Candidatus Polarisedimenticolia bacterium]
MSRARRHSVALSALAAAIACVLAIQPADSKETKPMKPTSNPAKDGAVRTILLPAPASPLTAFRIQFGCGSIDDPAGKEGLNALTALTIGEGGTREMTYRELTDRLYPMAATITPRFDRETTTFVGEAHRDHLKDYYGLLTGVLLRPRFDEADFQRSRDFLLAGLTTGLRGNDDEGLGKAALGYLMYEGHPYRLPDSGTVQGLKAITLEDVKAHYLRCYTQGNAVLGVAGGYPESLIVSMKKDFTALPPGGPRRAALPKPRPIQGVEVLLVEKPASATAISLGFPIAVTRSDRDFYALLVANSYLGEHRTFNGRLMNKMRGERGLNYGDYSYIEHFVQDGGSTLPLPNLSRRQQFFSIWIRPVEHPNALFALRQAVRELQRLVDSGMSAADFEATRKYVLNVSRLWTQNFSRRLGYRMDSDFYGFPSFIDRIQDELPRLKVEDVNAAVKRHLQGRNLAVAIVTPDAAAVKETLLSGRPTPITYQTPTTSETLLAEDKEIEAFPLPINRERVGIVKAQDLFER